MVRAGGVTGLPDIGDIELTLRLIGDYSIEDDTCCVSVTKQVLPTTLNAATANTFKTLNALGYVPVATTAYTRNNSPQDMRTDQKGVSLQADYDLGWATATSITAWRYWHFDPLQDSDGTPLDVIQVNVAKTRDEQVSQEGSPLGSRPIALALPRVIHRGQRVAHASPFTGAPLAAVPPTGGDSATNSVVICRGRWSVRAFSMAIVTRSEISLGDAIGLSRKWLFFLPRGARRRSRRLSRGT